MDNSDGYTGQEIPRGKTSRDLMTDVKTEPVDQPVDETDSNSHRHGTTSTVPRIETLNQTSKFRIKNSRMGPDNQRSPNPV